MNEKNKIELKREIKGITLIALVVTIIVILILASVAISLTIGQNGIFTRAQNATKKYEEASENEQTEMNKVENFIEDYNKENGEGVGEIDWDEVLQSAQKHPDQKNSNDIAVGTDGKSVNLDLWKYEKLEDGGKVIICLGDSDASAEQDVIPGYDETKVINGEIIGTVPQYIKLSGEDTFYPVTVLSYTFYNMKNLTKAPVMPTTLEIMNLTFYGSGITSTPQLLDGIQYMLGAFGETNITEAVVPNTVIDMMAAFINCKKIQKVQVSNNVTSMNSTFKGCSELKTVSEIPSTVMNMNGTFEDCKNLHGELVINADPSEYNSCFKGATTEEGISLILKGESTMLQRLKDTALDESHISIAE